MTKPLQLCPGVRVTDPARYRTAKERTASAGLPDVYREAALADLARLDAAEAQASLTAPTAHPSR